jgi:Holliday junction resolvase-like predicted endonuclease
MLEKPKSRGASNQQVGRSGEYFTVAELNKRGAFAVPFAGNMPKIDIIACNDDESRTVYIQVKTKRGGKTWHSSIVGSRPMSPIEDEKNFWVFVDLGDLDAHPRFWIVPDWWIKDDIYKAHQAYLNRHGGHRASNPDSMHHAIDEKRLSQWQERWEILGIFE